MPATSPRCDSAATLLSLTHTSLSHTLRSPTHTSLPHTLLPLSLAGAGPATSNLCGRRGSPWRRELTHPWPEDGPDLVLTPGSQIVFLFTPRQAPKRSSSASRGTAGNAPSLRETWISRYGPSTSPAAIEMGRPPATAPGKAWNLKPPTQAAARERVLY